MTALQLAKLDELLHVDHGLYESELKFIEDLSHKRWVNLSPKQAAWFEKIYDRIFVGNQSPGEYLQEEDFSDHNRYDDDGEAASRYEDD